jgi:hypothetical protein
MSIHFISGKPGGGKTLYAVRLIVDELVKGRRPIVTNVALKLGELNRYWQEKFPASYEREMGLVGTDASGPLRHISERVRIITEDDLPVFFTFRGRGVRLASVNNVEWKQGKRPDYGKVIDSGVMYVLDEVHIAFNSRAWADTGAEVLYYLSQHRKLGDDVVCITQSVANVDKQFRSVAQDFTYIKNLGKQKAGLFRLPALFVRSTYAQPATDTAKAMESGTFTLDVSGLASCYDTGVGVGIIGRAGADTQERKRGLHWLWFAVGVPILLVALFHYVPLALVHIMTPSRGVTSAPATHVPVSVAAVVAPVSAPAPVSVPSVPALAPVVSNLVDSAETLGVTNELYCTGYCKVGSDFVLFLSDGTTVDTDSGRVQTIEKTWVRVDGVRLSIKTASLVSARASVPPPRVESVDSEAPVIHAPILTGRHGNQFENLTVTPSVGRGHE